MRTVCARCLGCGVEPKTTVSDPEPCRECGGSAEWLIWKRRQDLEAKRVRNNRAREEK